MIEDKGIYINPLTDFGFKLFFGTEENKDLLVHFLNQLLSKAFRIEDLVLLPTERIGEKEEDRKAVFDVYAAGMNKEHYIIEMQNGSQKYFKDRSLYYPSFIIRKQGNKGTWDYQLPPIFFIAILNFRFTDEKFKKKKRVLHKISLKDEDGDIFYPKFGQFFLELPNFKMKVEKLKTDFHKWVYLLKNLAALQEPPEGFEEAIFQKVFELAKIANFSGEQRKAYNESMKRYNDYQNTLDYQVEVGKELGRAEKQHLLDQSNYQLEVAATTIQKERKEKLKERQEKLKERAAKHKERQLAIQALRKMGTSNEEIAKLLALPIEEVLKF